MAEVTILWLLQIQDPTLGVFLPYTIMCFFPILIIYHPTTHPSRALVIASPLPCSKVLKFAYFWVFPFLSMQLCKCDDFSSPLLCILYTCYCQVTKYLLNCFYLNFLVHYSSIWYHPWVVLFFEHYVRVHRTNKFYILLYKYFHLFSKKEKLLISYS